MAERTTTERQPNAEGKAMPDSSLREREADAGTSPPAQEQQVRLREQIEAQLWRWEAELAEAGIQENDKLRNLLFYAWQEARARNKRDDQEAAHA